MRETELRAAWPQYWATHGLTDSELARQRHRRRSQSGRVVLGKLIFLCALSQGEGILVI